MKGLVRKSKRFLPMNLSNPKEEFSNLEGIDCIGEGRSKAAGLKEKLAGGFSRGITLGFFNSSFGLLFPLIIHIQRGKLYFGPHGKMMREYGRKLFDI